MSVAPSGLRFLFYSDPGAARFALTPGYLLAAPSALHSRQIVLNLLSCSRRLLRLFKHRHVDLHEVAFARRGDRRQRHAGADLVGVDEDSRIFVELAGRHEELNGATLVRKCSREYEGLIDDCSQDVVGTIAGCVIADEYTNLPVVLFAGEVVTAGRNNVTDVDTDQSVGELGTNSERNGLDRSHEDYPSLLGDFREMGDFGFQSPLLLSNAGVNAVRKERVLRTLHPASYVPSRKGVLNECK